MPPPRLAWQQRALGAERELWQGFQGVRKKWKDRLQANFAQTYDTDKAFDRDANAYGRVVYKLTMRMLANMLGVVAVSSNNPLVAHLNRQTSYCWFVKTDVVRRSRIAFRVRASPWELPPNDSNGCDMTIGLAPRWYSGLPSTQNCFKKDLASLIWRDEETYSTFTVALNFRGTKFLYHPFSWWVRQKGDIVTYWALMRWKSSEFESLPRPIFLVIYEMVRDGTFYRLLDDAGVQD